MQTTLGQSGIGIICAIIQLECAYVLFVFSAPVAPIVQIQTDCQLIY